MPSVRAARSGRCRADPALMSSPPTRAPFNAGRPLAQQVGGAMDVRVERAIVRRSSPRAPAAACCGRCSRCRDRRAACRARVAAGSENSARSAHCTSKPAPWSQVPMTFRASKDRGCRPPGSSSHRELTQQLVGSRSGWIGDAFQISPRVGADRANFAPRSPSAPAHADRTAPPRPAGRSSRRARTSHRRRRSPAAGSS